ncbi:MAG: two-component system, chemotaxis family, protein-glutamate methylesterase/glutaminase [Solirubrobacteraceae bacterium]|nr:two-component system, chemotaxis family, protein-glutamate methylesterase/glutaminase [Solirubrobacteraceae bacterium]
MPAYGLIAMGASWGGLRAIECVLSGLPSDFPTAIAIAQHRSVDSGSGALSRMLSLRSGLDVCEAGDKDPVEAGKVYIAPADYHLLVEPDGFALSIDEPVQYSRPSIDVLLESAADTYGERMVGVILTGANEDGAHGLARVKRRGGVTIVQDPECAEKRAMPDAAIATGAADHVVELERIAPLLVELSARRRQTDGRAA